MIAPTPAAVTRGKLLFLLVSTLAFCAHSAFSPTTTAAGVDDHVSDGDYATEDCITAARVVLLDVLGDVTQSGLLTAGHCALRSDSVLELRNTGPYDLAVVAPDALVAPPELAAGEGRPYDPAVGLDDGLLCKAATGTTGAQCGPIVDSNYAPSYGVDSYGFIVVGGTRCLSGDSGGGWFVRGGPQDGAFFGVTSGAAGARSGFASGSCIVSGAWGIRWIVAA